MSTAIKVGEDADGGERNGHAEAACKILALLRIVAGLLVRNIMASSRLNQARDRRFDLVALLAGLMVATASAQPAQPQAAPKGPWMDKALSPDQRAEMVVQQMTLDEKIEVLHGRGGFQAEGAISNGGAGVIQGVPRPAGTIL